MNRIKERTDFFRNTSLHGIFLFLISSFKCGGNFTPKVKHTIFLEKVGDDDDDNADDDDDDDPLKRQILALAVA